jgi:hypothetical protein
MEWLILIHVLSAVLGLGPAYAFPLLLNKKKSLVEVTQMTNLVARLELFPKVFGTIALLSGLILFWLGDYGSIFTLWIGGTLLLYVLTQVVVIGLLIPAAKKLSNLLAHLRENGKEEANEESFILLGKVRNAHMLLSFLMTIIVVLMVIKPV